MNLWWVVGLFAAIAVVGLYLWWHSWRSRHMADKPQPKK